MKTCNPRQVVISDPRECKTIFYGGQGFETLQGFEQFPCLEELWVNNNCISKLTNLEQNFRLRHLFVHNNNITTLVGSSLPSLRNLNSLSLANNKLKDLHEQLSVLKRLTFLTHLDLSGNPMSKEMNYRLHVVHDIPTLKILDNHVISEQEKEESLKLYNEYYVPNVAFGKPLSDAEIQKKEELKKMAEQRWQKTTSEKRLEKLVKKLEKDNMDNEISNMVDFYRDHPGLEHQAKHEKIGAPPIPKALDFLGQRRAKEAEEKRLAEMKEESVKRPDYFKFTGSLLTKKIDPNTDEHVTL